MTAAKRKAGAPQGRRRRLASRAGTLVTTITLPRDLHRRAMLAGIERNWAFTEVVRVALGEWLDREEIQRTRRGGR